MSALSFLKRVAQSSSSSAANGNNNKRLRENGSEGGSSGAAPAAPKPFLVEHYDEASFEFPTLMDDSFPREQYRSRQGEVKTACHWGQRKLLLSEIQLLSQYCKPNVSYHIVYAGSAPGTHLAFLDRMFGRMHQWELVDPGQFNVPVLGPLPNFRLRNEFFTNQVAYELCARRIGATCPGLRAVYELITLDNPEAEKRARNKDLQAQLAPAVGTLDVARGTHDIPSMFEEPVPIPHGLGALFCVAMERRPMLFISDIRSGSLAHSNFEEHVAENMRAQQCWTEILQPDHALLKFRLPYTVRHGTGVINKDSGRGISAIEAGLADADGCVSYLRGDMLIPIWTRPTSTEGRLCVPRGAFRMRYNIADYEDQCFFLNARLRETFHFNHILAPHVDLDNHYDAAAEVHAITRYVEFMHPELVSWRASGDTSAAAKKQRLIQLVKQTCEAITKEIDCTFEGAIRRRDKMIMFQAAHGMTITDLFGDEDAPVLQIYGNEGASRTAELLETQPGSWEGEARRLIEAAGRERLRPLWNRNYVAPPPGSADRLPGTQWRCVGMPQH